MDLKIPAVFKELAARRPVFHSEADMQHELAWHLRETYPGLRVRLEYPRGSPLRGAIDLFVQNEHEAMALELKYLCRRFSCSFNDEIFYLKQQGAQDVRRYDVLKDVWRLETFCGTHPKVHAAVLVLSNDPSFWKGPNSGRAYSAAFSLREGRDVSGKLEWAEGTGVGTKRGRENSLELLGCYGLQWEDYSTIHDPHEHFRFLYIPVSR